MTLENPTDPQSGKPNRPATEKALAMMVAKANLTAEKFMEWQSLGYILRSHAHYGKNFVVWRHTPKGPHIIDSLTVVAVHCDTYDGFSVSITNQQSESQWVTHSPSQLFKLPIFVHVPFMPDITFLPKPKDDKHFQLKFPLVIKTEGNPRFLTEGLTYLTQLGEFRATFPEYKDLQP